VFRFLRKSSYWFAYRKLTSMLREGATHRTASRVPGRLSETRLKHGAQAGGNTAVAETAMRCAKRLEQMRNECKPKNRARPRGNA